ncbi:DUF4435 domain-containing protein [Variovorax paradoxus]|uniref:DUF4435 domain-containing protein n=1 Tax=Variovorax paradoxus TaxID=34073 RepID=UPI003ED0ABC5
MRDQVEYLRQESRSSHAQFHQYLLAMSSSGLDDLFFFFEGQDDPAFYIPHLMPNTAGRSYFEFGCDGRESVLDAHRLWNGDGRAKGRTLFFIDKDLTDLLEKKFDAPSPIFQTEVYSFENYIVDVNTFRRFWVERLRLDVLDPRFLACKEQFCILHKSFNRKMRLISSAILYGMGVAGRRSFKLNLNNVNLDKVFEVDLLKNVVRWKKGAIDHLYSNSSMKEYGVVLSIGDVRLVYRDHLRSAAPKSYVRGKYELWFFTQFLAKLTRLLSDRAEAKKRGLRRAMPGEIISHASAIDSLSPLSVCPPSLQLFLKSSLAAPKH